MSAFPTGSGRPACSAANIPQRQIPAFAGLFQRLFPHIRVDADRIFVRDGGVWTSAGITSGIDLTLALIEDDFGIEVSKAVARDMVVYHRRSGGDAPASVVERLRVEAALPRIQKGTEPIEIVARKVGFADKDRMRRAFLRIYGQPPRALRRTTIASKSRAHGPL